MTKIKINKKGQITIPKEFREKHGLVPGISLDIRADGDKIIVKPAYTCHNCGKALPDELGSRGACADCPPPKVFIVY